MNSHPELETEQDYIDTAYAMLDKGLADAERSMSEFKPLHRSTAQAIQRALRILQESRGTGQLVFGKMRADGEEIYIGRRRVRNESFEPLVVSWHAPAAQLFYEASPVDTHGLDLKRVFTEEERRLVRVIDEIVAASAAAATDSSGHGTMFSDALLSELDRSRDGAMRDVVATIQAEQYAVIRAPLGRVVVVEGGPGTGKTVVGLHRAAWLAFNHEELRREGVLVVAPSTAFLTYVSGVLPSLDVTDVDQVELQRLYAGEAEVRGTDDTETARVKGSAAMAAVLRAALSQRIGWDDSDLVLGLGADRIRVPASTVRTVLDEARGRDLSHLDGRKWLRSSLARAAAEIHRVDQQQVGRPVRATEATIRRLSAFVNAVDRMWPSFTPEELLRSLYSTQAWLVQAAEGILPPADRARLFRPQSDSIHDEPWSEADLFCLDELSSLLTRDVVTYGHLIVDEAQDLSPMQARALARRCPSGSFTVLGDLAQTTSAWIRDEWRELTEHLADTPTEVYTLSIGYRVPAAVLELAAQQLALAGAGLTPPMSIRTGAGTPRILRTSDEELPALVVSEVAAASEAGQSVGILVADGDYDAWAGHFAARGLEVGDGRDGDFSSRATLVPRSGAKGLEFDAVVLVEPAAFAAEALQPPRALYVAMTRCTQALTIAHASDLPAGFPGAPTALIADETLPVPAPAADSTADDADDDLHVLYLQLTPSDQALVRQLIVRLLDTHDSGSST